MKGTRRRLNKDGSTSYVCQEGRGLRLLCGRKDGAPQPAGILYGDADVEIAVRLDG